MARSSPPTIEQRTAALEQRVAVLESERPGRKPKPMLAIRQRDVCSLDPSRDSTTCPDASIYRYQSGCHGAACRMKQHNAYERRKNGKETPTKVTVTKKAPPAKKAPAKKVAPAAPTKKTAVPAKATKRPTKRATKPVSKRTAA